jgi:hypothetical protein
MRVNRNWKGRKIWYCLTTYNGWYWCKKLRKWVDTENFDWSHSASSHRYCSTMKKAWKAFMNAPEGTILGKTVRVGQKLEKYTEWQK